MTANNAHPLWFFHRWVGILHFQFLPVQEIPQQPPGTYFVFAERKRSEFQRDEGTVLLGHGDRGGDRQHLIPVI